MVQVIEKRDKDLGTGSGIEFCEFCAITMTVSNYDSQVALNDFRKVDIQTVITTDRESLFLRIQEGCALGPKLGLLAGWRSAQCGTTKPR